VRKTKAQIRATLTRLLMEKDLKDITVSELTAMADINRGTFYQHYRDIYDLFEKTEREILDDFAGIIERYRKRAQIPLRPILLEAFRFIQVNADIIIAYLRTKETTFLDRIVEMCRPQDPVEWKKLLYGVAPEQYEYYYSFITYGCIALFKRWFGSGMVESPETMADLALKLMANCASNP